MNPACRKTMEDAHCIVDKFGGKPGQALFAVFDGHGGRDIVNYLSANFADILKTEMEYENGSRSINECLTSAYLITDINTSKQGILKSGSTAATVLIREENNERVVYCANVGDTRAVACLKDGAAYRLTYDHKATDPAEVKRIEAAGGFILRKRVLGILSVSRSFGDHAMKKYVVSRPYTTTMRIGDTDRFLIIACDGIWDVFSDDDAVQFITDKLDKEGASESEVAKLLVDEALRRDSQDNITAIVIFF